MTTPRHRQPLFPEILAKAIEVRYGNIALLRGASAPEQPTCATHRGGKGGGMGKVMVYIVHDRSVSQAVQEVLTELKIDHYSRFRDAMEARQVQPGKEEDPEPRSVTIAVVEDSLRRRLLDRLKALQVDSPLTGIRAFVVSVLDTL